MAKIQVAGLVTFYDRTQVRRQRLIPFVIKFSFGTGLLVGTSSHGTGNTFDMSSDDSETLPDMSSLVLNPETTAGALEADRQRLKLDRQKYELECDREDRRAKAELERRRELRDLNTSRAKAYVEIAQGVLKLIIGLCILFMGYNLHMGGDKLGGFLLGAGMGVFGISGLTSASDSSKVKRPNPDEA